MNKLVVIILFATLIITSCEKNNSELPYINTSSEWNLDDQFNSLEQSFFDTLNFKNTAEFIMEENGSLHASPTITFHPNPFFNVCYLSYNTAPIINIAILNSRYKKILEARFEDAYEIAFNLSDQPSGTYLLYYVIQDKDYNIVQLGHGSIIKE
ncbi:hypothetical protein [Plebeiibacterium sediminum]|uniref:Uncharacterized protein n=1 Tax=Plebeiibacterium sediminum TaxID=2992112 RepID=A0AAE3M4S1_9BACT|nr:hypothetical protein [Plebeiobacterium sediminum]MCW3786894.1 hypothetical protein [Plebeiobacterium sediminum]